MWKYSSTHIISSNKDFYVNEAGTEGAKETSPLGASFVVGKNFKFFEKAVTEVRKALPVEAQTESIKFDLATAELTEKELCRLYLYIRSVDNADPLYANDWIYKGKPFLIEFKAGTDATASAKNLANKAKKWLNFEFGKKVLTITAEGSEVTIEVVDDTNLRFYKVEVQQFEVADKDNDYADSFYADSGFVTMAGWSLNSEVNDSYDVKLVDEIADIYVQPGKAGFGTYDFILRNLRMPTNANMLWNSVNGIAGEMPAVGASYVQYIVKQCTDRPEVQGSSVIGQYNKSVTLHSIWVLNDETLIEEFLNGLQSVMTNVEGGDFASVENEEESTNDSTADGDTTGGTTGGDTTGDTTVEP